VQFWGGLFAVLNSDDGFVWFVDAIFAEGLGKIEDVFGGAAGLPGSGGFGIEFLLKEDGALGMEDGLGDVAEDAGFFGGDTVVSESEEDFGHDFPDIFGIGKISGGFGKFRSEGVVVGGRVVRRVVGGVMLAEG
jgi:hypothetical protein